MYTVKLRNTKKGNRLEEYTTPISNRNELERSLEIFKMGGYEVVDITEIPLATEKGA